MMLATLIHLQKTIVAAGAVLVAVCLASIGVGATTINFDGLAPGPFTSYTESGFTVTSVSGNWSESDYGNPGPSIIFTNPPDTTGSVVVTDAGKPFSFSSIQLYSSITPIPYTFTGLLNGNTVFTASGTVPNTFGDFAKVANPDGVDVINTLQVTLSNPASCCSNPVGLDNIVVAPPGTIVGDPHLTTYSGHDYTFQGAGDFVLSQSTVPGDPFDVQVKTRAPQSGSPVTIVSEVAVRLGNDRVVFNLDRARAGGSFVWIDGSAISLSAAHPVIALGAGRIIELSPTQYQVIWNTGEYLYITRGVAALGVDSWLSPTDGPGSVEGLLGSDNWNGDFRLPDGAILDPWLSPSNLYDVFAEAWRVTDATSLFAAPMAVPEPATVTFYSIVIGLTGLSLWAFPRLGSKPHQPVKVSRQATARFTCRSDADYRYRAASPTARIPLYALHLVD